LEYQKNRLNVISQQNTYCDDLVKTIEESISKIKQQLEQFKKRHPFLPVEHLQKMFGDFPNDAVTVIYEARDNHPDLLSEDTLRERLTQLLEGRVGSPYPQSKLTEKQKIAKQRYDKNQPPGYRDGKKDDPYGDAILWLQLLDYAQSEKCPLILVTDDRKDDWWTRHQGKIIGPRPELIQEMRDVAEVQFYMYSYGKFLEYVKKYLSFDIPSEVTEEVRELEKQHDISERKALSDYITTAAAMNDYVTTTDVLQKAIGHIPDYNKLFTTNAIEQLVSDQTRLARIISEQDRSHISAMEDALRKTIGHVPDYNQLFATEAIERLVSNQTRLAQIISEQDHSHLLAVEDAISAAADKLQKAIGHVPGYEDNNSESSADQDNDVNQDKKMDDTDQNDE
jgi:hypothetical protein